MWREVIFIDVRKHSDPESQLWNDDLEKGSENTGLLERLDSWGLGSQSQQGQEPAEWNQGSTDSQLLSLLSVPSRSGRRRKDSLVRKVKGSFSQSTLSPPWLHYLTIHLHSLSLSTFPHLSPFCSLHFKLKFLGHVLTAFLQSWVDVNHYWKLFPCQFPCPWQLTTLLDKLMRAV